MCQCLCFQCYGIQIWQLHWSVGAVAAIYKTADTNFQMSDFSGNNEGRNLMLVSISMFSGSEKPNMIHIMFLVVISAVVYSIV